MKIKEKRQFVLELSEEEVNWLRGVMQNPINCEHPVDEEQIDREMREKFWEATNAD